ncbi:MAG TPA: extracellular solute-binding protein [Candidatus Latescibacteria bacterium]|nr:extracellular solute-binding protein [Candidatus Latescibacterota bacterium]
MRMDRFVLTVAVGLLAGCGGNEGLVVFHAGSLSIPFKRLGEEFGRRTGVRVVREASGSRLAARKVVQFGRRADVIAVSDYTVIEDLMMPEHARWYALFATNEMVIALSPKAKFGDEIGPDNWYEVLLRPGVSFGRGNEEVDPCGYRTLMVWQLAEIYYDVPGLADRLFHACPPEHIRPNSEALLPLLETRDLDYAFLYLSVALQHKLRFVKLPPQVNLGDPSSEDLYRRASVELEGRRPGERIVKRGRPIAYAITIPKDPPNPELALRFVRFVLSEDGASIVRGCGQVPLDPPRFKGDVPPEVRGRR